jgi:hypothetical protein
MVKPLTSILVVVPWFRATRIEATCNPFGSTLTGTLTPVVLGTAVEPKAIVDEPTFKLKAAVSPATQVKLPVDKVTPERPDGVQA